MVKQPQDGEGKVYQPEDRCNTGENAGRLEDKTDIPQLEFNLEDVSEDMRRLESKMNEDIENILNSSKPAMPYHFSEHYEKKLKSSLEEKFGTEKAKMILEAREKSRKAAEEEYKRFIISNDILPDTYSEKSRHSHLHIFKSRKKRYSGNLKKMLHKFPKSNLVKVASAFIFISLGVLVFNKSEVNAYWWESIEFVINSYEEYSQIEAHNVVDKGDVKYPETIEKKYVPKKVADGYEEVVKQDYIKQFIIIYDDGNNHSYVFKQETQDVGQHINTEDTKYVQCDTLYGIAYYCKNLGESQLHWDYEGYLFSILGDLSKEEMLEVVNSIVMDK